MANPLPNTRNTVLTSLTLVSITLFACNAAAQENAVKSEDQPSAPVVVPNTPSVPSIPPETEAQRAVQRGQALAQRGIYHTAIAEFSRAAELEPSAHTSLMLAVCHTHVGHYALARSILEETLASPNGLNEQERADAAAYLGEIERILGRIRLTLSEPKVGILVDGRALVHLKQISLTAPDAWVGGVATSTTPAEVAGRSFTIEVDPGLHEITWSKPGFHTLTTRQFVPRGQTTQLDVQLRPLPPKWPLVKLSAIFGFVGVLGATTTAVLVSLFKDDAGCIGTRCRDLAKFDQAQRAASAFPWFLGSLGIGSGFAILKVYEDVNASKGSVNGNHVARIQVNVNPQAASFGVLYTF